MASGRATVFGGSGFLGRHIVKHLANAGYVVRVAVRHPDDALFLKPMGDVGQIVPVSADVRDEKTVLAAVDGVDTVVNAVGLYVEHGKATFDAVHVRGAESVAAQSAAAGVSRLIHISGIGATVQSESAYAGARGAGEDAVSSAFPAATILRPSVVFGPEDAFFNKFAMLAKLSPVLPLFGGGKSKVQPVYVGDVASAVVNALSDDTTKGKIFELGGPRVFTYSELLRLLMREIRRQRLLVPVPFFAAEIAAALLGILPNPLITRDQVKLMRSDAVVGPDALGLDALGVKPTAVETILPLYMDQYRRGGRWSNPRLA